MNLDTKRRIPLGLGPLTAESFSIFFRNSLRILGLAFTAAFVWSILAFFGLPYLGRLLFPPSTWTQNGEVLFIYFVCIYYFVYLVFCVCLSALIAQLTYRMKTGRYKHFLTLRSIFPKLIFSTSVLCGTSIASITALTSVWPGLIEWSLFWFPPPWFWISVVFYVFVPVTVIEQEGLRALKRSAVLTKGYRFSIAAQFIVFGVICGAMTAAGISAGVALLIVYHDSFLLASLLGALTFFLFAIGYCLICIATTLIYLRLVEIKEGGVLRDIASVFD